MRAVEGRIVVLWQVLAAAFAISAFSGVFALLNSGQIVSSRTLLATAGYSGMLGFAVTALLFEQYGSKPVALFGLDAILGLSGVKAMDILPFAWKWLGIIVNAAGQKDKPNE